MPSVIEMEDDSVMQRKTGPLGTSSHALGSLARACMHRGTLSWVSPGCANLKWDVIGLDDDG